MQFDNDLSKQSKSTRRYLTNDEKFAVKWWFQELAVAAEADELPDNIFQDMSSIEDQFKMDGKLSEAQMKYVNDMVNKYCYGFRKEDNDYDR